VHSVGSTDRECRTPVIGALNNLVLKSVRDSGDKRAPSEPIKSRERLSMTLGIEHPPQNVISCPSQLSKPLVEAFAEPLTELLRKLFSVSHRRGSEKSLQKSLQPKSLRTALVVRSRVGRSSANGRRSARIWGFRR
jgi:hypothetical protein